MSPARIIVHGCGHSFHTEQLVPFLFQILGLLMSEMETTMMKANSLVFYIWLRNSQREKVDDILIGEHSDDSDETVPEKFDESEATDGKRVFALVDRILRCCRVLS